MKPCNARRKLACTVALLSLALFSGSLVAQSPATEKRTGPRKPTNTEHLALLGFEATPEGLAQALESPKPFARIYALKVISENSDPSFLPQAREQLQHEYIKVQLEGAKLLAQFNRPEGLAWLRGCETRVGDDPTFSADTAHVVLDAAIALAKRGDERLARQVSTCLRHESWAVKFHAARALGDFRDLSKADLEGAWMTSADVVIDTIQSDQASQADYLKLYLQWLNGSASKQSQSTPSVQAKFAGLAAIDHAVTSRLREEISAKWKVKMSEKKSDNSPE